MTALRYEFIRTPLERPLMRLRHALGYFDRRRHPELREVFLEPERIQALLERVVHRSSNCVDVGCHMGSMLSAFCRLAPEGHHVAFEAIPEKVRFLKRKFPEVDVREKAVCDRSGRTRFYLNPTDSGFSGLARLGDRPVQELEVASARLDDELPHDRRFDVLKIDVEGAELSVLQGATDYIARDRPSILFECGPEGPQAFGYGPGQLHEILTRTLGYQVFRLGDALQGFEPVDRAGFESALVYPFQAFNWFALPAERCDARAPAPASHDTAS